MLFLFCGETTALTPKAVFWFGCCLLQQEDKFFLTSSFLLSFSFLAGIYVAQGVGMHKLFPSVILLHFFMIIRHKLDYVFEVTRGYEVIGGVNTIWIHLI